MLYSLCNRHVRGFLITNNPDARELILSLWPDEQITWTHFNKGASCLERLFTNPPDLLVVDNQLPDMAGVELVKIIKSENVYRQLPVILCLPPDSLECCLDWSTMETDDFLILPLTPDETRARLTLTLARASRSLDANPLSKLPGNTSIIQRIQSMMDAGEDFALAYADLDHFKSFNDKYGFSRGDEALLMTARLIVNTVRSFQIQSSFVGHVGGDDFVFIMPPDQVETACQQVVERFDAIVPSFYDQQDQEHGHIRSTDRKGKIQTFPLMAISLAVLFNTNGRMKHFGEASAIAMGLKKKAKENPKSSYVLDKRTY